MNAPRRRARSRAAPQPRWPAAFVLLAAICAVGVALGVGSVVARTPSALELVVRAVGERRTIEGRIAGFPFVPASPIRGSRPEPIGWAVLSAAATVQDLADRAPSPENLHALGVAALQAGHFDAAVQALEDALSSGAENAAYLSDLAAAYLARHAHGGAAIDVPRALSAADRAVRANPRVREAQFNLALALGALHLRHEEARAWDDYLQAFGDEVGWAGEARTRRHDAAREPVPLAPSPAVVADRVLDDWAAVAVTSPAAADLPALRSSDPFYADLAAAIGAASGAARRALAQSLLDLRAAETAVADAQYALSGTRAAQAAARSGHVPAIAAWAMRHRITAAFYAGRAAEGHAAAEHLLAEVQTRRYRALEADIHLRLASFDYSAGSYDRALVGYERAMAIRDGIGDARGAASASLAAAEALRSLGRAPEAWEHYERVLALGPTSDAILDHVRLISPAVGNSNNDMPSVVLALAREDAAGPALGNQGLMTIAAYTEARALIRLGDSAAAEQRLVSARAAFDAVTDGTLRTRILPELAFAAAEISWASRPAAAVLAVRQAEQGFGSNSTRHRLLALAVIEARAERTAGRTAAAEQALLKGVALVEEQQRLIGRADFLPSFIDASWDVFSELVDLEASLGRPALALQWLDRGYDVDRRWQAQAGEVSWAELSAAGPVVAYLARPDGLWLWVVRDGVVRQQRLPVTYRTLVNRSTRIARLLTLDEAGAALRAELATLAAEVLWPVTAMIPSDVGRVAFVLDPVLQHTPLALLPWSATSTQRVVDVTATVICPSVVACSAPPDEGGVARARVAALYSSTGDGELAALPLARSEAERIGRHHAGASVSIASEAALVAALGHADLVHFAGHAAADEQYPGRSTLVLTDDSGRAVRVPLTRILAGGVAAHTLVLSACRTSTEEKRRGHGGTGMAGEFLRAGVHHVVATQWDVQDRAASDVMDLVHDSLARGAAPWDAVRQAQQIIARDPTRPARDWAGYVAFTAASSSTGATVSHVSLPPRAERP